MSTFQFEISGTIGPGGPIELAYIRFHEAPVDKTVEIEGDHLLTDYDAGGNVIGLEILAPIRTVALDLVLSPEQRAAVERALPEVLKAA